MSGAIIFLLGWFLGLIHGIAVDLKKSMEKKLKAKNERNMKSYKKQITYIKKGNVAKCKLKSNI